MLKISPCDQAAHEILWLDIERVGLPGPPGRAWLLTSRRPSTGVRTLGPASAFVIGIAGAILELWMRSSQFLLLEILKQLERKSIT